jgi:hypothetical protein
MPGFGVALCALPALLLRSGFVAHHLFDKLDPFTLQALQRNRAGKFLPVLPQRIPPIDGIPHQPGRFCKIAA